MWTLIKEESRRWVTTALNVPRLINRYKYPTEAGPISHQADLQHRLQKNDIEAYSESAQNIKSIVNYRKSQGSYLRDVDNNVLLNFSSKQNPVGYNHEELIHSFKQREFDNHINQSMNVQQTETTDFQENKKNILSISGYEGYDVVFTESSGSLALNLAAMVARELYGSLTVRKAKDLEVSPHEISYITFKGDNNGDSLAFTQNENLPSPPYRIQLNLPKKGQMAATLAQIESLFSSNSNIGVVFIEGYQTKTGQECEIQFYQELQRLCSIHKVFLAVNEIHSGFGASGTTWWAHQKWQLDQAPEFIIFGGRTQTAGFYAPTSLVEMLNLHDRSEKVDMVGVVKMSQIIEIIKKNDLLGKVATRGEQMKMELEELDLVEGVSGRGVNITLQLTQDSNEVANKLLKKGIIAERGQGNTLLLQPDYKIGEDEIMKLKKTLNEL